MAFFSAYPARRGFGRGLVFNAVALAGFAWYFLIAPDGTGVSGQVEIGSGQRVDTQAEAEDLAEKLALQADRITRIAQARKAQREAERAEAARWLERTEAPAEPLARGGVRINRGLEAGDDGPRRIRVIPLE